MTGSLLLRVIWETGLFIEKIAGHMRIGVGTVVRVLQMVGKEPTHVG
jgi:hypothetical protein